MLWDMISPRRGKVLIADAAFLPIEGKKKRGTIIFNVKGLLLARPGERKEGSCEAGFLWFRFRQGERRKRRSFFSWD